MEKIIFESRPQHYVTGILFLPDAVRHRPPYPGVLVPCGHSANGKASNAYQTMGALLALYGMVGFVFDPIDQGERGQLLSQWPQLIGTRAHTMLGIGSILLGRNTASFEVWNGMRAIDYMQSRPEVDAKCLLSNSSRPAGVCWRPTCGESVRRSLTMRGGCVRQPESIGRMS